MRCAGRTLSGRHEPVSSRAEGQSVSVEVRAGDSQTGSGRNLKQEVPTISMTDVTGCKLQPDSLDLGAPLAPPMRRREFVKQSARLAAGFSLVAAAGCSRRSEHATASATSGGELRRK